MSVSHILDIACDESGHTGPDLLHKDQQYFAFGSISMSDSDAYELIQKLRNENPVQMPELKASRLMASERGRRFVLALLNECEGRYAVNVLNKLLALCGWFFEYIYEPVYQDNPGLLYEKNLHRFVAMYTFLWMTDETSQARRAIEEFQKYMRSRDPADAPFLFGEPRPPLSPDGNEHPFETILQFATGYRDIIVADNARLDTELPDGGRWALDLSASGLWSHLNYWGRTGKFLSVRCDTSKPIQSIVSSFTGDDNDPAIFLQRARGNKTRLGWRLLEPVQFVDSRNHPANQIADVIAGAAVWLFANDVPVGTEPIFDCIRRHLLEDSILPDMDIINPTNRSAAVNALILYDLAKRAERNGDPYENLEAMYHAAEVSWARGDFNLTKKAEQ